MAPTHVGTAEVESAINSTAFATDARVRSFARGDDGRIEVTLSFAEADANADGADAKGGEKSQDGGGVKASLDAIAERTPATTDEREADGEKSQDGDDFECLNDGCDRRFASANARNGHMGSCEHASANPDGESDEKSQDGGDPSTARDYVLAYGPCVAAKDAGTDAPCGHGANGESAVFCAKHARIDDPDVSTAALAAAQAHERGEREPVREFADEHC
jgi:hypothetical protein